MFSGDYLGFFLLFFGFFALILVAVFWINRAVSLFDWLIGDGQSVLAFLEISALSLPNLVRMVLPLAAFAATVWVTNRLNSESELTVLRATGSSPWQLARPAMAFGVLSAAMMSALSLFLLPASLSWPRPDLRLIGVDEGRAQRLERPEGRGERGQT